LSNSQASLEAPLQGPSSFNGEERLLKMFIRDVRKIPMLSKDEERSLMAGAAAGDKDAQNKLVEANLRFVIKTALEFWSLASGLSLMDLIQGGALGLMRAVQAIDPDRGVRFLTYGAVAVRWGVLRCIADHRRYQKYVRLSLDDPLFEDDGDGKGETHLDRLCAGESPADLGALHGQLTALVDRLRERDREVIRGKFYQGATLSELGRLLCLSRQRICQIEARALFLLRRVIRDNDPLCCMSRGRC